MNGKRIYFVRRADGTGPIKIGCSANIEARVRQLSSDYRAKFRVLATIPGDFTDERNLHLKLAKHRVDMGSKKPGSSEWFNPSSAVLSALGHIIATGELPLRKADCRERIFAERYLAGETLKQIGDDYGITLERVRQVLRRCGVESLGWRRENCKKPHDLTENEIVAANAYKCGTPTGEILRRFGLKQHQLRAAVRRCGFEMRAPGANPKIDAENVIRLYRDGVPIRQIAERAGMSHATYIYRLIRRHGIAPARTPNSGNFGPRKVA